VDADHMPPYALPDNKTRVTFKTLTSPGDGSSNEIHFEDAKGAEQMYIHASRDVTTDVGNDRADTVKGNAKLFVARDQTLDVRATQDVHVNGNDVLTIGGDWREDVAVDHKNTVKKSQITVIGGTRKLATGQNAQARRRRGPGPQGRRGDAGRHARRGEVDVAHPSRARRGGRSSRPRPATWARRSGRR
jgi:uncharacterized protein involved in type VI secretion and phage assembly